MEIGTAVIAFESPLKEMDVDAVDVPAQFLRKLVEGSTEG